MILKLVLTIVIDVVDWGKTKWHTILKNVRVDFLKQDFEWTQEWLWYLDIVEGNTVESILKVLDFAFGKGNKFNALMKFSIWVGLKILGWILMEVANLVVVCFKRCSLVKQILHVG